MGNFIGNEPATSFETVRKQVSTSNSGTTITLDHAVTNVQDILVTINAVVQSYDNYSVSGTTLTVGGTLSNDRVEILYVGRTFQSVNPSASSVGTSQLVDDAVTDAKIVDMAASKLTGTVAQANIADQAINEAKMQVSNSPVNGYMLTAQSGNTGGLTWAEAPSGDFVRLNSVTGTGLSDITFDNFSSTYEVYKIIGSHTMSSDNAQTRMRVRKSGSDQTSGHYRWAFGETSRTSGGGGTSENSSWNNDHVRITKGSSSADAHPTGFEFTIYSPSDSTRQSACFLNSFFYESGGVNAWKAWTGSIWLDSTTGVDITGIKFYPESGNFNNAKYSIYALKDS